MDATIDVVDLTAVMPGYRSIAQLYTDSRSAIDQFVSEKDQPPAAKILKPTSLWLRLSGTRCCQNTKKLHERPLMGWVEIVLNRTDILDKLERRPIIYKYIKPSNLSINLNCYLPHGGV
ncbi:hypothetical protein QUA42_07185 [Microcoleus sp. Pol11C2]|uniref:hypothetical protein n=1 Tax=Microcoleus sp. Pol11C2 TaxID=3055389 RepID=UPI002FCF9A2A